MVGYRQQLTHGVTLQRQLTAAADFNIWLQQFTSSINSSRDITAAENQLQQQLTATIRGFVILKILKKKIFSYYNVLQTSNEFANIITFYSIKRKYIFSKNHSQVWFTHVENVHFVIFFVRNTSNSARFWIFCISCLTATIPYAWLLFGTAIFVHIQEDISCINKQESEKKKNRQVYMFILRW